VAGPNDRGVLFQPQPLTPLRVHLTTGGDWLITPEGVPRVPPLAGCSAAGGIREAGDTHHDRASRLPRRQPPASGTLRPEKSQGPAASRSPATSAFSRPEALTSRFSAGAVGKSRKSREKKARSMSTHTATGVNWADAIEPLAARRRAHVVASFAENVAKDSHGDANRSVEAIAWLVRRRPEAVDARMLRRAAGQAQNAGVGR
jgi:hypothetical protein